MARDIRLIQKKIYTEQSRSLLSREISLSSLFTHRHSQDVGELVRFCLAKAVPCICDKNNWHQKLSLRVDQLLERLFCSRDWHPSPDKHAINVKQQPEAWLWLQERGTNTGLSAKLWTNTKLKKWGKLRNRMWIKQGDRHALPKWSKLGWNPV